MKKFPQTFPSDTRAAQVVPDCQPGCEKMERECENVDEIERE